MPPNSTELESTSEALIAESLFFALLSLVILAGNTLVCTAIYKNRKLRTKTNYYLVSLAVADIMVGVFSVPYWIYHRLGKTKSISCSCLEVTKGYIRNNRQQWFEMRLKGACMALLSSFVIAKLNAPFLIKIRDQTVPAL